MVCVIDNNIEYNVKDIENNLIEVVCIWEDRF